MERDDLKVARVRRMAQRMGAIASNDEQRGFVDALDHVLALTRPTADLGEDGELIAALWSYAHDLKVAVPLRQAMEDARDRLILYMEALVKADKCGSCDRPRSSYCATCERDWQS